MREIPGSIPGAAFPHKNQRYHCHMVIMSDVLLPRPTSVHPAANLPIHEVMGFSRAATGRSTSTIRVHRGRLHSSSTMSVYVCMCILYCACTGHCRSSAVGVVTLPVCIVGQHGCSAPLSALMSTHVRCGQDMNSHIMTVGLMVWLPPRVRDAPGSIPRGVGTLAEKGYVS